MSERSEKAAGIYAENFNCAQAVLCAFGDVTGLDDAQAKRLASSFGGGMGNMKEMCGALTGAFMVAGLAQGFTEATRDNKRAHSARIDDIAAEFRERFGCMLCRDLLQKNKDDGSAEREAKPCTKFVAAATEIMEKRL